MNRSLQPTIRPAAKEDLPVLLDIIREIFHSYDMAFDPENDFPDLMAFDHHYPEGQRELYVMEYGSEVIGCGGLQTDREGIPYLYRVYIASSLQGFGYGKQLVRFLIEEAFRYHSYVYLWSDTRFTKAHKLYTELGFTHDGSTRPLHDVNKSYEWCYELYQQNYVTP